MGKWRDERTFGPIGEIRDGRIRIHCTRCAFRVGTACTYVKPFVRMTDLENTPEWCELRADILKEAEAVLAEQAAVSSPKR